jgi:hypothetical protein
MVRQAHHGSPRNDHPSITLKCHPELVEGLKGGEDDLPF